MSLLLYNHHRTSQLLFYTTATNRRHLNKCVLFTTTTTTTSTTAGGSVVGCCRHVKCYHNNNNNNNQRPALLQMKGIIGDCDRKCNRDYRMTQQWNTIGSNISNNMMTNARRSSHRCATFSTNFSHTGNNNNHHNNHHNAPITAEDAIGQQQQQQQQQNLIQMANSLLDGYKYPIGTYSVEEYSKIKLILYYYIHLDRPTSKEMINHPIDLLLRWTQEVAYIHNNKKNKNVPTTTATTTTTTTTENNNDNNGTSTTTMSTGTTADDNVSNRSNRNETVNASSNATSYEYILNATYYNPLIATWKNASLNNKDRIPQIYTGLDVIQKMQHMSKLLPAIYRVNIVTITMVLQVVIKQVRRDEAPLICEKLLHTMAIQLQKQKDENKHLPNVNSLRVQKEMELYQPNIYSYNILLKAWAESRLDQTSDRIAAIVLEMTNVHQMELGLISYKILLRYYSRIGDVANVNRLLQQMHTKQLPIDVDCLGQALKCCCTAMQIDNAFTILKMIIHQHPNNIGRAKTIQESIHHIVVAYRNRIDIAQQASNESKVNTDDDMDSDESQQPPDTLSLQTERPEFDDTTTFGADSTDANNNNNNNNKDAVTQQQQQQQVPIAEIFQNTIERLEELTNIVRTNNLLDPQSKEISYMFGMMLELYIRANLLTNAKELVRKELPKSIHAYSLLLKAYGDNNQAQLATRILYDLLQNSDNSTTGLIPNTQMFNIVMEAWCKSKNIDGAYEQLYALFDTLQNYPKCQRNKIRPNAYTYGIILESILSLDVPGGASKAEEILDDLEKTYNRKFFSDDPNDQVDLDYIIRPDISMYLLVMKLWIQSNDCDRAMVILQRMQKFTNIVPDRQMFHDLLNFYAKAGNEKAAESAENVFKLMKKSFEPQFYAFNIINRAWLKSGSTKAADKLWLLYDEMKQINMRPDRSLYLQLIQLFTSRKENTYIRRAKVLLHDMEEDNQKYVVPTHYTMIIMAYLEIDELDEAIGILSKFVRAFGHVDSQLVPIVSQLIKVWIDKGHYKKATILVNAMQEFHDSGLLRQGVSRDTFEILKAAWESSNDPDKSFIIEQIDDIMKHFSVLLPELPNTTKTNSKEDDS